MRMISAMLGVLLLAGCATRAPVRAVRQSPARPAAVGSTAVTAEPVAASGGASGAASAEPAVVKQPSTAPTPGVPLMGFRPMRGQTGSGA